jgi:hypothetical protein
MTSVFRDDARNAFLHQIRANARTVLETLAEMPLQAYTAGAPLDPSRRWEIVSVASENLLPDLVPLRDAIAAWMTRWHLDAPWVGETALDTLRYWEMVPSLLKRLEWCWRSPAWMEADQLGPAPWTPHGDESSQDARRRLTAWHKAQLAEIARQEKGARAQGLPTEPGRHQPQTIDWAIRFQVLEEPASKIAPDVCKEVTTVREAIYGFLDFIELARRSVIGRPAGSRSHAGVQKATTRHS